jgi:DNA recombination protein RmuC
MDINTIIILMGLFIAIGIATAIILRAQKKPVDNDSQKLMLDVIENLRRDIQDGHVQNRQEIQARLDKMNEQLNLGLSDSSKTLQRQFAQSSQMIREVTSELTTLKETNKQVLGFSEQLQSLENILKNPKQRGILGEYFLETLLSQVLQPNQYKMQYKFPDGEIVDAAIFLNQQVIPIDAKFSLEKYNKLMEEKNKERRDEIEKSFKMDIKNRIDETAKYIRPQEGTTDFALMFIPAEGIFYNLLIYKVGTAGVNTEDLVEYAFKKRVIITSPTSFFAYLQTILQGLRALKVEQSVKEIVKNIHRLSKHMNAYEENFKKIGHHLGTTVGTYNNAYKEFGKIDKDVYKITNGSEGGNVEIDLIDKPQEE